VSVVQDVVIQVGLATIDTVVLPKIIIVTTGEMVTQGHILLVEEEVMAHNTTQDHLPVLVVLSQSLIKTETAN